jgi:CRP/FNR family transcriptional regulator, cyclic AMP receptor protein
MALRDELKRIDLFAALPDSALDDLIQSGTSFTLSPGKTIVQQGASDVGFQIVRAGSATVTVNDVERGSIGEGDFFGEISLFDPDGRRSATVIAGPAGVETFAISALTFSSVMDKYPQIARALLPVLVRRIQAAGAVPLA